MWQAKAQAPALLRWVWTVVFAYASIIEWQHFRRAIARRNRVEMWGTCTAAIACGFMASEALGDEWP